jgi:hypothetical protein
MRIPVRRLLSLLSLVLAAVALSSTPAAAAAAPACDRYATPTGSDDAAGTLSAPLRSPQRLMESLQPGETGCLGEGTYTGTGPDGIVLYGRSGGQPDAPITVRSTPGERATLRGVIYLNRDADDIRLTNLTLIAQRPRNPVDGMHGIFTYGARTALIDNDISNSHATSCLILGNIEQRGVDSGRAVDTLVSGNVFRNCGSPQHGMHDHAIYLARTLRATIVDNVFVGSSGWAIHLYPNAQRTLVQGNVMYGNAGSVIFAGEDPWRSNHNVVVDNIMAGSRKVPEVSGSYPSRPGRGNQVRGNCIAPGLAVTDGDTAGYRMIDNRVADTATCLALVADTLLARLVAAVPTVAALLRA